MEELNLIQKISVFALPVLFAITLHEAAHAYVAKYWGDNTAYNLGRVSLNPLRHIDPVGTILLPLLCVAVGGFLFGWAKPVPVRFGNLRNVRAGMRWVAAAGPLANFAMAVMWVLLFKLAVTMNNGYSEPLALMSQAGITINVVLMVLNLMPLLPLDGGRIVESLLPARMAYQYSRLEPYGMWVLLALVITGLLSPILRPFIDIVYNLLYLLVRA